MSIEVMGKEIKLVLPTIEVGLDAVYTKVVEEIDRVREEYENGADYSRDEYNFDDGYVSALEWVLEVIKLEV